MRGIQILTLMLVLKTLINSGNSENDFISNTDVSIKNIN
jgi:hypothetical protein